MFIEFLGDGACDDDTNTPECEYDGGDCCLPEVITDYCDLCECIQEEEEEKGDN